MHALHHSQLQHISQPLQFDDDSNADDSLQQFARNATAATMSAIQISTLFTIALTYLTSFTLADVAEDVATIVDEVLPASAASYPYQKTESVGISLGPQMSLSIPQWALSLMFIAFLAVLAYVIKTIFDTERQKDLEKAGKEAKRQAKAIRKGKASAATSTQATAPTATTSTTSTKPASRKAGRSSSRKQE